MPQSATTSATADTLVYHYCGSKPKQDMTAAFPDYFESAEKGDAVHEMSPAAPDAKSTPLPGLEQDVSIADGMTNTGLEPLGCLD